jgi:hypothetical protein
MVPTAFSPPPPKEGVLRIFIAPKNLSPSAEFEPTNFGSSSMHGNHYAAEDDELTHTFRKRYLRFALLMEV